MSDPVLILIQNIDKKVDQLQTDVSSLKETRAENKGVVKAAVAMSMGSAAFVSWLIDRIYH